MPSEYRDNHYVPQWYQRRFVESKGEKLLYLDHEPASYLGSDGVRRTRRSVEPRSPKKCFYETDLYTTRFGDTESTDIEKFFFGRIDNSGGLGAAYFANFAHPSMNEEAIRSLVRHMSAQKLRTPKGLAWLRAMTLTVSRNDLLRAMQEFADLFAAVWCEAIWQIADASDSPTKFIISDHPVTVYNRECSPDSESCAGENDPDVRWHGTHTFFPLNLNKVLIMTNLSWVRNPYQNATAMRPNPTLLRSAVFDFQKIQTSRRLSEREVLEINLITKRRAYKYAAAAKEEWLYPEHRLQNSTWRELGEGLLLMPDPRSVGFYGKTIVAHNDGRYSSWDEYGLLPGQEGFADEHRADDERKMHYRFIGEFSRRIGPERRGRAFHMIHLDPERDSDDMHATNLEYETEYHRVRKI
jgi:hypothetical protein